MKKRYRYTSGEDENKNWTAALYVRLSVEDGDKGESNSVINQKQLLSDYISENNDFNFYDYYVDDGYSGTDFDRPAFKRLLDDMKNKKFNTIIVKDLSRLGRNYIEVGNYIEQIFPLFNIRFIAINDNIDSYGDPTSVNNVIVPFKNLINDEYCRDISNKIRSVLTMKKRRGEYVAAFTPYGYIKDPKDNHHLIIDEEAARVVKMIYRWSLEGCGRKKIAKKLNDMGILNPMGHKQLELNKKVGGRRKSNEELSYAWDMTVLQRILEDQTYCGDTIQNRGKLISYKVHKYVKNPRNDWIIVKNTHEPIIDRDTWEKVQEAINYRDTRVCKTGYLTYFAGHIKCADCGRAMIKNPSGYYKGKPRPYYYYVCSTYKQKSIDLCTSHNIRNTVLEEGVLEAIKLQVKLIVDFEKTLTEIKNINNIDYRIETMKDRLKILEQKVEKQKNLKKMVYEDWKLGNISEDEYKEYSISYTDSIEKMQENIQHIEEELEKFNKNDNNSIWIDKFTKYRNITQLSKEVVDELIEDIYVHEGKEITIKFKYEDEYQKAIEYIKRNESLTLLNNNEKIV